MPSPSQTFSGVGGVFESGELLWKPYREFVLTEWPEAQVVAPAYPPLVGALILALRKDGVDTPQEWLEQVWDSYASVVLKGP